MNYSITNSSVSAYTRADLHIHSYFSKDSLLTPGEIVKLSVKRGLNVIAVTDHNTIRGGIRTKKAARNTSLLVIPGIEVKTNLGDVTLLFVEEDPPSREFDELLDFARSIGAITILPHPFRGHRMLNHLILNVDVIEVMNGRTPKKYNIMARELAKLTKKPQSAGSDAHCSLELGCIQLIFPIQIDDEEEFRRALLNATSYITGKESPILVHVISTLTQFIRKPLN